MAELCVISFKTYPNFDATLFTKVKNLRSYNDDCIKEEEGGRYTFSYGNSFVITIPEALSIGHDFEVTGYIGEFVERHEIEDLTVRATGTPVNKKTNVILPSNELLNITDIFVEVNACTERIKIHLDSGYKILAICLQPDQRRPDYILGK